MNQTTNHKGGGYVEPSVSGGDQQLPPDIPGRIGGLEDLTQNILTLVVVSLVGVVVTVVVGAATLTLDQMHYNNELYRDGTYTHTTTLHTTSTQVDTYQPVVFPNMKPSQ